MSTIRAYEKGDYRRVCDICGVLWTRRDLRKLADGKFVCPDEVGERSTITLDALNARVREHDVKPAPNPAPAVDIGSWESTEGPLFNFIADGPLPFRYIDVTNGDGAIAGSADALTVAEGVRYLYSVVTENLRGPFEIARARSRIQALADYLLTIQFGAPEAGSDWQPTGEALVGTSGGFAPSPLAIQRIYSEDVAAGGLALLYAYRLFGSIKYKAGAERSATLLRRMQRCDALTINYTATNAGARATVPMFVHSWRIVGS